jgi:subtilisin-like proprotein convertase family protein
MLNFNTQKRLSHRFLSLSGKALKAISPLPNALKTGLAATFLICCTYTPDLFGQCSPDVTAPTAQCKGPFTIALNTNGQAPINPNDIDNGSSDNCGAVTLTVSPNLVTCANLGPVPVTLTVKDLAGNTNTCVTVVTVVDNLPPVITCPANVTYTTCPANTAPAATGFASATDNCGGILSQAGVYCGASPYPTGITYCDVSGGCTGGGITRTWRATYDGLTSTCVQTIAINDTQAPVIDWNGAAAGNGSGPANTSVTCTAGPPAALTFPGGNISISDNCTPSNMLINTVTDVSTKSADPSTCAYTSYTITRTYKSTDACGNMATHVQTISVNNTAPVVTPPPAINLPAGANCQTNVSSGLATATVSDCTPNAHLIMAFAVFNTVNGQIVNSGNGLNASGNYLPGTYSIVYSVIDPCGLQGQATTAMNIVDNVAPTAVCNSLLITISIPPTGTATLLPSQVNNGSTDNCTPTNQLTLTVAPNTFTCTDIGSTLPVVLTVKDANGNMNTCNAMVSIVDNSPPAPFCKNITKQLSVSNPGMVTVNAIEIDNGSSDVCDPSLDYNISKDGGITYAPSVSFGCSETGANAVILRVTDNYGNHAYCNATVTVQDVTQPTAVCNPVTVCLNQDGMATINDDGVSKTFNKDEIPDLAIPDNNPAGASSTLAIAESGIIADLNVSLNITHTWIGDLEVTLTSPGGTPVTVTLFDNNCGNADNLVVTFDDESGNLISGICNSPVANSGTFRPFSPLSAFDGEQINGTWTLKVVDNAGADVGTLNAWSITASYHGGTSILNLLGAGTTDNCSATWTVNVNMFDCNDIDTNPNQPGNQPVTYILTATDPSGNTKTCSSTITVVDKIAPVISCKDRTLSVNSSGTLTVLPTDFVSGGMYLSSGNNLSGNSGSTQYCITAPNLMTFTFDWDYATQNTHPGCDPFGYYINGTFTQLTTGVICSSVLPPDGPLTQSGTATVTLQAGQVFCFRANTFDNILGRSETWVTNFSPTFTGPFAPGNWALSNTSADGKGFFYDACGVSTWQIRHSLDGGSTWSAWSANSTFNCSNIAAAPPIVLEISATDPSGNTSFCGPVNLTVLDQQPPQAQCQPLTVSLNGGGTATVPASDFNFGSTDVCCGTALTFTASKDNNTFSSSLSFNCSNIGTHPITLKVTDCAPVANSAYCVTSIMIKDVLPPAIVCPADITINCNAYTGAAPNPNITGLATATDNCTSPVTPVFTDMFQVNGGGFNHPDCRVIKRTWTATDGATPPNTSLCFQYITIVDNVAPSLDWNGATAGGAAPGNVTVNACNIPAAATPSGVDNCATPTPVYTQTDSRFSGNPLTNQFNPGQCGYYNYTLTRKWTVTDNCGNMSMHTQTLTVQDAQAPTYTFPAMFMFNNNPGICAGTANINLLTYISDCAPDANLTISYKIDFGPEQFGSTLNNLLTVGSHNVAVKAVDPCNNMANGTLATINFTIVIKDNESPVAKCKTGPLPISLNSNGQATITPADVNNNSTDNCSVASLDVSPALFTCATTPNPHPVVLTVTDGAGNFNTCTTSVVINNLSPPTITCPGPATVACNFFVANNPATSGGAATGNSSCGPVTPTYTDAVTTPMGINNNCRTITRTWTVTTAGGSASCTQTIQIVDNTPPSLVGLPGNINAQACAVPAPPNVTATDNCSSPGVTYGETSTQHADPANCLHYQYTLTRTWSTTDGCNAPVSASRMVTVVDNIAPAITIPNPLIISTDPNKCEANLNVNLLTYIADCAADQYLMVTNNAPSGNGAAMITGIYAIGDYSVTVTAKDPCNNMSSQTFTLRIQDNQAPQAACLPAVTLILDSNGNGSLTPADIDNGSLDNCGPVTLGISPNTFNTSNVGVVNVVLTVTDGTGNTSQCTTPVTVIERGTVAADNVSGQMNTTVSVPVTVTGFDNVCALSFSMHLVGAAGNITGVGGFNLPGMSASDFGGSGNNRTFSWVSGVPVTVPDGTTIFHVNVSLTGAVGSMSNLVIDGSPLSVMMARCDLSTVPVTTLDGSVTVVVTPSNVTLSGTIQRENGSNVQLVNVGMTGTVNATQTTGAPGTYSFTVPAGSSETITPVKDINDCNGINVLDVLTLQLHILGAPANQLPTPYLRIAADVNNDGSINVLDRLELHLIVLAGNPCIGLANNTSWRFVPSNYVFPNPLNPFAPPYPQSISYTNVMSAQTGNFIGVKIGDLDLTANPANFGPAPTADGGNGTLAFSIDDYAISAGQEYRVEFRAKDFANYAAYQYTLGFDENVLKFKQVEMGALPQLTAQNFGLSNAANGTITSIWYNSEATTMADDEVLFTLVFDAIAGADKLSKLIHIGSDPVAAEAYTSDLVKKEIGITFNSVTGVYDTAKETFALYQNRPNPFSNETIIPFYLPQASHATLTITDVSGRKVWISEGDFPVGQHEFKISNKELPSHGVYFYTLETESGKAVKKMILID